MAFLYTFDMATLNTYVELIKESLSSFSVTDDFRIDDELIITNINFIRDTLIREEFNNNRVISPEYYTMSCCNEIKCDDTTCVLDGIEVSDNINQKYIDLKPHVKRIGSLAIKYVGNKNGSLNIDLVTFEEFISTEGRVWTKNSPVATINSNKMFFKNIPEGMKFVCLLEVLSDPRNGCNWKDDESNYPVPSETKLVDMVVYRLMSKEAYPRDLLNNASDDISTSKTASNVVAQQQELANSSNQQRLRQQKTK